MKSFCWVSEVRAHEIDVQGIVNNAHYLSYFDHARTLHLRELGVDWAKLSEEGFNLVLIQANIHFLSSLRAFDSFKVDSTVSCDGRLKIVFNQAIFNNKEQKICTGLNTIVCVDSLRNKPIAIDKIAGLQMF